MSNICPRCRHVNPENANFCEQCRLPQRLQQEGAVDHLAHRMAEENDRLARLRQEEWLHGMRNPVFPKWFIWLGWVAGAYLVVLVIYLVFILH